MDEIDSSTKGFIWKEVWAKRITERNTNDFVKNTNKTLCGKIKINILYVLDENTGTELQKIILNHVRLFSSALKYRLPVYGQQCASTQKC